MIAVHHRQGRARVRARPQPVGDQGRLVARLGSRARAIVTCASAPSTSWLAWRLTGGAAHVTDRTNAAVTGLTTADCSDWNDDVLSVVRRPSLHAAGHRRHVGRHRAGDRAARRSPARRLGRRPAGQPGRPELRPAGRHQDHLRHGRHARHVRRRPTAGHGTTPRARHVPDRRLVGGRTHRVGRRGHHAVGRHQRRVAARRHGSHRDGGRQPRRRPGVQQPPTASCTCRRCSAWAHRGGTTAPAARCSASLVAPDVRTWCGQCSKGSPIAAPTWSRQRKPTPARTIDTLRVDGGMSRQPDVRAGTGRCVAAPGRDRPGRPMPPPWGPATWRGSRQGCGRRSTTSPRSGGRPARVEPAGPLDRARWADAVGRAAGWIPDLSALDF